MRITSILRAGTLALALAAGMTTVAPAFAHTMSSTQAQQASNSGPYDGPSFQAQQHAAEAWGG